MVDLKRTSYLETFIKSSIEEAEVMQTDPKPSWINSIVHYLQDGMLPANRDEAKKLRYLAP